MDEIKDFFNVTLFKSRKPTYDENKDFMVGDRGILFKIVLTYDYGLEDLFGKTFQIQYLLPNNGLYIDDFLIENHGMVITRRIDDRCFNNKGNVFVKFAIKDVNTDVYIQIPYNISFEVKESFIKAEFLTEGVQAIMVEGLIKRINLMVEKYVENNVGNIITEAVNNIISDTVIPKSIEDVDKYIQDKINNINLEPKVITEQIIEKYDNKQLYSYIDSEISKIKNSIKIEETNTNDIEYSDKFIVNNNTLYLNDEVTIVDNIKIFSMKNIKSTSYPLKTNSKIYIPTKTNEYVEFVLEKVEDGAEEKLINFLIDYKKKKSYEQLEQMKQSIINDYMSSYLFGINVSLNQKVLKEWYYNQIEKINKYNDLSKDLIIDKLY